MRRDSRRNGSRRSGRKSNNFPQAGRSTAFPNLIFGKKICGISFEIPLFCAFPKSGAFSQGRKFLRETQPFREPSG